MFGNARPAGLRGGCMVPIDCDVPEHFGNRLGNRGGREWFGGEETGANRVAVEAVFTKGGQKAV